MRNQISKLKVLLPLAVAGLLALNYFVLTKLESRLIEIVNTNDALTLDFATKNILSNSIEAQINIQDSPITVHLSPSYFSGTTRYELKIANVADVTKSMMLFLGYPPELADQTKSKELKIDGEYHFTTRRSTINARQLDLQQDDGSFIQAEKVTLGMYHDENYNFETITSIQVTGLNISDIFTVGYFDYDILDTNLEALRIQSKSDGISINEEDIKKALQTMIPNQIEAPKLFPMSHDFSLSVDQRIIKFLSGQPQDIDSPMHTKGHLIFASPLMVTDLGFSGAIEVGDSDFTATAELNSNTTIGDEKNFDLFRALLNQISSAFQLNIQADSASPSNISVKSKVMAKIDSSGTPKLIQGFLNEDRFYSDQNHSYIHLNLLPLDLAQPMLGIFISIDGVFSPIPAPEEARLFIRIKTNTLDKIADLHPILQNTNPIPGKEYTVDIYI